MFRYDDPTSVPVQPAPTAEGTPGFYTDDPGAPSDVRAEHLNNIQEEICNTITAAGITLTKGSQSQLLAAIKVLSASVGFTTGDLKLTDKTAADPGWVLSNDGTIGNAASGATTRANADTAALFAVYWNGYSDAKCPVSGGRGASAAADYAANKTIRLPLRRGKVIGVAGAGAGLTARVLGDAAGEEAHTLVAAELPATSFTVKGGGIHGATGVTNDNAGALAGYGWGGNTVDTLTNPMTVGPLGSGTASNVMQPTEFSNLMIKL